MTQTSSPQASTEPGTLRQHPEALIVGAGFAGIGMGIALDRAGMRDWELVEQGDDVGGTWHWNTYPGIGVDIPSFSYQFGFERRTNWSRVYASGGELDTYAQECTEKYGLRDRMRFGVRVLSATYDDDTDRWTIETTAGTVYPRFFIAATGALTTPKYPDIPGLDTFAGPSFHTARWDHDVDLTGKRVGIIGTGASAVQVVPAIAPQVEQLVVFQRTPIWCMPRFDPILTPRVQRALRVIPGLDYAVRAASQAFVEIQFPLTAQFGGPIIDKLAGSGLKHLRSQVDDPVTREQLTPKYALGCKRPSFSNTYLKTFNRENVRLETTSIRRITPTGVVVADADGTEHEHELDVLILATGFLVTERGNLPPFPMRGTGTNDLGERWDRERLQSYEGISVPGFPNWFTVFGPWGYNGSSYFNLIDTSTTHIVRVIREAERRGAGRVEVRQEAQDEYMRHMWAGRRWAVFNNPTCGQANSYYFDRHGDTPIRPSTSAGVWWRSRRFNLDDYAYAGRR